MSMPLVEPASPVTNVLPIGPDVVMASALVPKSLGGRDSDQPPIPSVVMPV